jgi:hypothetical protein
VTEVLEVVQYADIKWFLDIPDMELFMDVLDILDA